MKLGVGLGGLVSMLTGCTCKIIKGRYKGFIVDVRHIVEPHPVYKEERYMVRIISAGRYYLRCKIIHKLCLEVVSK